LGLRVVVIQPLIHRGIELVAQKPLFLRCARPAEHVENAMVVSGRKVARRDTLRAHHRCLVIMVKFL